MTPGLCSVTFRSMTAGEVVDVARRSGLEAVEWGGDVHVPPGDAAAARDARSRTNDAGLRCASYGSYWQAGSRQDPSRVLDTACMLGAPHVRIWCRHGVRPGCAGADFDSVVDGVRSACAAAADRGLHVSLEFHRGTLTETAASACAVVDAAGAANLSCYFQPVGLQRVHDLGTRLSHLHVFWWRRDGTRLPLSGGEGYWRDVLAHTSELPAPAGGRVAFLEFVRGDDPDALAADAAALRSWL